VPFIVPIYDFLCGACGEVTETIQKHADPPPKCCGKLTKRMISKTSFALKGEGWYKDHYGLKEKK
jgi:putative FmdB family regulatory protein